MPKHNPFIYIGLSRLHRNRANVIQTLHTVTALASIGLDVHLYLPPWKRYLNVSRRLAELGVKENFHLHRSQFLHSRWRRYGRAPFFWLYGHILKSPNVVYTRSVPISMGLSARNIYHHLEIHDSGELVKKNYLKNLCYLHRTRRIGTLFPISEAVKTFLIENGADPSRIVVLPSGVNIDAFTDVPPLDPKALQKPTVLYVGRISKTRGLEIFETIAQRNEAKIILVGEVEDQPLHLSKIRLVPFVPHSQVPSYYAKAQIVLLPYQPNLEHVQSISPMKLFEAMAAGRPIIASNIPTIREILDNGETGLLVDPEDIEGWLEAVKKLKNNPGMALKLAMKCRKKASDYTWQAR
ncbi:MAG TPA: glycosyltransferase, partial [Deltaproteobacteria bacterium]|nr:glycosyltransferase [Deltaproteobacteria bacterium]